MFYQFQERYPSFVGGWNKFSFSYICPYCRTSERKSRYSAIGLSPGWYFILFTDSICFRGISLSPKFFKDEILNFERNDGNGIRFLDIFVFGPKVWEMYKIFEFWVLTCYLENMKRVASSYYVTIQNELIIVNYKT